MLHFLNLSYKREKTHTLVQVHSFWQNLKQHWAQTQVWHQTKQLQDKDLWWGYVTKQAQCLKSPFLNCVETVPAHPVSFLSFSWISGQLHFLVKGLLPNNFLCPLYRPLLLLTHSTLILHHSQEPWAYDHVAQTSRAHLK